MIISDFEEITKSKPEKYLTVAKKRISGRNNQGRITMRRRGGGHKRRLRIIDFKRDKHGIPGVVKAIEYDPNRSARIALIFYKDGEKRYILAPNGLKVGDVILAGEKAEVAIGNSLPLSKIPLGAEIHNIELKPGKGGQLARAAGTYAKVLAKDKGFAQIKLSSSEVRLIPLNCYATIGQVGNVDHINQQSGKAGRTRWLGRRPKVRGTVMNPCDHPHGGGEGKNKSAGRQPCSPWAVLCKGFKTRKNKRTDKYILKRRK